ncbi:hypothetical protein [Segniliparus rotundus]|uniref:hypothetical protein n=1 Tax=Segniliparus rotundus TaxID=286802 RepID=UPI00059E0478|nr:hypothetical protein [Segniliparus rotundus]
MRLDVDKARQAGREVLRAGSELASNPVAAALRAAADGLEGLGSAGDSLREAADVYGAYARRFADEHEWLGDAVISAANQVEATDESAKADIEKLGIPG